MALFVLSLCPFDISVGVGAFVIGLRQISSFLSLTLEMNNVHRAILIHLINHEIIQQNLELGELIQISQLLDTYLYMYD